jgi:hypothetical protein
LTHISQRACPDEHHHNPAMASPLPVDDPASGQTSSHKTARAIANRTQERRASARRGYRYRSCNGASTNSRQTADGVCADRRCGRVYGCHGANVAPESVMRHAALDYNRVHWRHGGLTPPALVLRCERLPAKQRFLRCTNAHSTKSGGREPAVVIGIAGATQYVLVESGGCQPTVVR